MNHQRNQISRKANKLIVSKLFLNIIREKKLDFLNSINKEITIQKEVRKINDHVYTKIQLGQMFEMHDGSQ